MNLALLAANALILITFIAHTFWGDTEYRILEPVDGSTDHREKWTMGRGAFHIVSADFLLAFIGLTLINFTEHVKEKSLILTLLSIYFFAYGLAFLLTLIISKKFKNSFLKLGQWLLLFTIAGLIYWGRE
ncbi:MAG: hypothetical protein IM574_09085 [Cytophagales bacterium]|jgi:hypothetical protein|nr:hypothetical protein [Cytophagales bacterium]MCA6386346.1 hypothetical protein [Cytophagales bacterium]MCA6390483.1 hypothetical protein [Cytophagales bacterium]MCA6395061.1 hypothetical protein [Cytophagales bacterium]MCA6397971.1 hypothetical protein [Cytophagales bacterium]